MAFPMFQAQTSPIAIDFGTSSVKMLQIASGEGREQVVAAAELTIPDAARADDQQRRAFLSEFLPGFLAKSKGKGKRAVIAIPSSQTFIQHMRLAPSDGTSTEDLIKGELSAQMGVSLGGIVVRHLEVGSFNRDGQLRQEVICLAMSKDTVMQYIELLRKLKITVVGVHTEPQSMVHAFDHLYRRDGDELTTTLYADIGWGGTQIAIAHGRDVVCARYIPIGGSQYDQITARALDCDLATARAHRITMAEQVSRQNCGVRGQAILSAASAAHAADQPGESHTPSAADRRAGSTPAEFASPLAGGPSVGTRVDMAEMLDTLADEILACDRYHRTLFPDRPLDRVILLGGEARHQWLCGPVVREIGVAAQLGDPLCRLSTEGAAIQPGLAINDPQPGWAVACGLCQAPTDL